MRRPAVFSLVFIVLAQRYGMVVSVGGAVAVWFIVAFLLRSVSWTFAGRGGDQSGALRRLHRAHATAIATS